MAYCIYLRKSRADMEAEARGEGETLAIHKRRLLELAAARGLPIAEIYSEILSGDTISDRPEMQRLLHDVEQGKWEGVLCNDIDRLGRGDGADQSRILKTFKFTNTLIITPYKDYNLSSSESDEEHMEFQQQFARFEYRHIKRRMLAGRVASAQAGYYMPPQAPFGYRRVRIGESKHFTLAPDPSEANAVRMIFDEYAKGLGFYALSRQLNNMGFMSSVGKHFFSTSVRNMLVNPVYIGKIRYNYRQKKKCIVDGQETSSRAYSDDYVLVDGLHPAIITQAQWDAVQHMIENHPEAHIKRNKEMTNPLCSLLYCSECGHSMICGHSTVYAGDTRLYRCGTYGCSTTSIAYCHVMNALRDTLSAWVELADSGELPVKLNTSHDTTESIRNNIKQLNAQKERLHDLLETGVYDSVTYLERMGKLETRLRDAQAELAKITKPHDASSAIIANRDLIVQALDVWDTATPRELNTLLRRIIAKIIYHKTAICHRNSNPADFLQLDVYPLLPS